MKKLTQQRSLLIKHGLTGLKERQRSTPQELDFERIRIMKEVYEETARRRTNPAAGQVPGSYAGSQEDFHRRQPLCRHHGRKLYGYLSESGMERRWMKEEKTVENSKTKEDKEAKPMGSRLLGKAWAEEPDTESIFQTDAMVLIQARPTNQALLFLSMTGQVAAETSTTRWYTSKASPV